MPYHFAWHKVWVDEDGNVISPHDEEDIFEDGEPSPTSLLQFSCERASHFLLMQTVKLGLQPSLCTPFERMLMSQCGTILMSSLRNQVRTRARGSILLAPQQLSCGGHRAVAAAHHIAGSMA